ncbi:MAG TPA: DUF2358 domain-containing protein [Pseudomonadales bacterium]
MIKQAEQVLERYIRLFNQIESEISSVEDIVSEKVEFLDPFHHTFGIVAYKDMLLKTARALENPRFDVSHTAWDQQLCFIRWDFSAKNRFLGKLQFSGMSELHFDENYKILRHIDHWDSARYFYRRLPVIRWFFS